jgi:hypothetical protein
MRPLPHLCLLRVPKLGLGAVRIELVALLRIDEDLVRVADLLEARLVGLASLGGARLVWVVQARQAVIRLAHLRVQVVWIRV